MLIRRRVKQTLRLVVKWIRHSLRGPKTKQMRHYIMVDRPSKGLIVFRCCCCCCCCKTPGVGVLVTELLGVICGVIGVSILGLAMVEAPNARV